MANDNVVKYKKPLNLNIGVLFFIVIIIYVLVFLFSYMNSEQVVGYEVKEGSLSSNNYYTGIAVRNEKIIPCTSAGYVNYYAREGERCAVGDLIYTLDESGKLNQYLTTNENGESSLTSEELSELRNEVISFMNGFDKNTFSSVYNFKYTMESTAVKLANYNALQNASLINDESNSSLVNYNYSPTSGIIIYSIDGYEDKNLNNITVEDFDKNNYEKNYLSNNDLLASGDPAYKLSTDEDWSIIIIVDKETADMLVEEEYVNVKFLKNQYTSWASVSEYTDAADNTFVQLSFTNSMITFITDRFIDIELLLEDESGLKIPKSSIVEKEFFIVPKSYFTYGNGKNQGVLLESYDEEGNASTNFIETTIYEETDTEYYLDDSVLKSGDYIVKPESLQKFAISKTGTLIGVYNINKGYADFREITILYENDEYAIVKPNTTYGLNVYDYIVLDAQTANESEFIYE